MSTIPLSPKDQLYPDLTPSNIIPTLGSDFSFRFEKDFFIVELFESGSKQVSWLFLKSIFFKEKIKAV